MNAKIDRRQFVKAVGAAVVLGPSALACDCYIPAKPIEFSVGFEDIEVCIGLEGLDALDTHTGKYAVSVWPLTKPSRFPEATLMVDNKIGCDHTGNGSIENPFKTWQHAVRVISM